MRTLSYISHVSGSSQKVFIVLFTTSKDFDLCVCVRAHQLKWQEAHDCQQPGAGCYVEFGAWPWRTPTLILQGTRQRASRNHQHQFVLKRSRDVSWGPYQHRHVYSKKLCMYLLNISSWIKYILYNYYVFYKYFKRRI